MVEKIESGELSLEATIERFEQGSKLAEKLTAKLAEAEARIQKLEKQSSGELEAVDFSVDDES